MTSYKISIFKTLWKETVYGLYVRGMGKRETACIWAGQKTSEFHLVQEVIFLDDLAGVWSGIRGHSTSTRAIDRLFSILREKKLSIIADLHTHPLEWVGLSPVDMEHPLEYRVGFLMIVFPYYASPEVKLADVGVHEYQGNGEWRELPPREVSRRILIQE